MARKPQPPPDQNTPAWKLRRLECGLCEQRLDRAKEGMCAAIYSGKDQCHWYHVLNGRPSPQSGDAK